MKPIKTKLTEFLANDQLQQFYPCNQLAVNNILPFSRDGLLLGVDNASTNNYLEPQHIFIGPTANTAVNISRYWPLNQVKDTILDMDKDLVFGSDMYLRLWTNMLQRMGFYTTSPNTPHIAANFTAVNATATASNVYLYLAIEENMTIRNSLLSHLANGSLKLSIPYSYCYRFSAVGNGGGSANVSLTLTKNYGRCIKRIMFVPCNGQEFTSYGFSHDNVNGTKINQVQSTMDGRPF